MTTPGRQPILSASPDPVATAVGPWATAVVGLVALAVAMGIGRFAFTPLLPMMLAEGGLDLPAAGWLASANYLGYLAGALAVTLQPWWVERGGRVVSADGTRSLRLGLLATGALTIAMALPWPAAWPVLRFAAGVASAVVLIHTAGWCLARLARLDAARLGGVMFAGPGAGIVGSGLAASGMLALAWPAAAAWFVFGLLAFGLTAWVWPRLAAPADGAPDMAAGADRPATADTAARGPAASARIELAGLAVAYGLSGFGYIVTATFLPVIARQALPGSAWIDLFWPIFGLAVVVGALATTRLRGLGDQRLRLAVAYGMQAAGIACSLVRPDLAGFVVGSLLLGLPFTAITLFAMQEVRRLRPPSLAAAMGLLTTLFSLGQVVGPVLAAELLRRDAATGFQRSLVMAALALLAGAVVFLALRHAHPLQPGSAAT